MMLYYATKSGCKRTSSLEDVVKNDHIMLIYALDVTLTLKIVNQFLFITLHLMIKYHHTKYGEKWLNGAGDTVWTRSDRDRKKK